MTATVPTRHWLPRRSGPAPRPRPVPLAASVAPAPTASGLDLDRLDNDLAGWLDRTLIRTGVLPPAAFEAAFTAIVRSSAPDPLDAWTAFYRNTLTQLLDGHPRPGGTIAEWAPIHALAESLTVGPGVLELGCCFGFLSLRLARAGHTVHALDLTPGSARLLRAMSVRLSLPLHPLAGDATAVPLADRSVDTVLAIHLLEHVPDPHAVLTEMLRVARRRVIVAVPYEDEPNPTWGHLRRYTPATLAALGARTHPGFRRLDHDGGWLVLDR